MVVLIIAVLLAISIPTYLGARTRAMDRGAQSTVRNAFVAARISYAGSTSYTSDTSAMALIEPNLQWTSTDLSATSPSQAAYLAVSSGNQVIVLGARAANGHCFFIEDIMAGPSTGTRFYGDASSPAICAAPAVGDPAWSGSW
ncbi:MAG: type pilus assembly protein PilA [Actinomycetota bacterium]|nr:type pilus assembly protein PilA [Actinomycetota bacterium]